MFIDYTTILNNISHPMFKEDIYQFVKQSNRHVIIGFGAYGEVKLAKNARTKQNVAIKLIYGKNAQQEISLHKQLNNSRIIKLINHFYDEGKNTTFMVLEYAGGGSLHRYIKTNCLDKREIKRIFREVCEGVQALHQNKMMHRDIKPENILLTEEKEVKLCDFGFASILGERKTMCGTYEYMSPEMVQKQPYDLKIDIWALGILLYQMIEGHAPFAGNTPQQVLNEMKKVIMFSDNFDQEQIEVIKKILRVKPSNRPRIEEILEMEYVRESKEKSIRTTVSSGKSEKEMESGMFSSVGGMGGLWDLKSPTSLFFKGGMESKCLNSESFKEHYSSK